MILHTLCITNFINENKDLDLDGLLNSLENNDFTSL